jgi:hypothetical protein
MGISSLHIICYAFTETVGREHVVFEEGEIEGNDFGGKRKSGYKTDPDSSVSSMSSRSFILFP